jgi:hypothetical protein
MRTVQLFPLTTQGGLSTRAALDGDAATAVSASSAAAYAPRLDQLVHAPPRKADRL